MKITSFNIELSDDHVKSVKKVFGQNNTDPDLSGSNVVKPNTVLTVENNENRGNPDLIGYEDNRVNPYHVVRIGWSFTSKLKLPWYPVLAAAGALCIHTYTYMYIHIYV
jgi:hypothetical protein